MEFALKIEQPINILVQRRGSIGDVIMTTPVVRELKKRYGATAEIDVATDFIEVYRNNPYIRNIIAVNDVPEIDAGYDIFINLDDAYELNPENHYIDSYLCRAFGNIIPADSTVELFPSEEDKKQVDQDIADIGDQYIVVHMRNWHWGAKNITLETWFDVYAQIFEQRTDFKVVCVGGQTDFCVEDHPLFVDLRGKYNSQQLKHLCDNAQAFVGIDSGPFQCAAASNTHIIALLTHLHPERIMPRRPGFNATAISTNEDCRGCNDSQQRPIRQIVCQHNDYRCTNNFNTRLIAQSILGQLK